MAANTMIFLAFISVLLMGRCQNRFSISFLVFDVTAFEFVYFGGRKAHSYIVTAFHVPSGHPETMKRRVGWAKRSEAHRNFRASNSCLIEISSRSSPRLRVSA